MEELHVAEYAMYLSCLTRYSILMNDLDAAQKAVDIWEKLLEEFEIVRSDFSLLKSKVKMLSKGAGK